MCPYFYCFGFKLFETVVSTKRVSLASVGEVAVSCQTVPKGVRDMKILLNGAQLVAACDLCIKEVTTQGEVCDGKCVDSENRKW